MRKKTELEKHSSKLEFIQAMLAKTINEIKSNNIYIYTSKEYDYWLKLLEIEIKMEQH